MTSSHPGREEVTCSKKTAEVIKTQSAKLDNQSEPRIYRVKILQDASGGFCISVTHTGYFRLRDYEVLEFEVESARLVKKNNGGV